MIALLLVIGLFLYVSLVGQAVISLLKPRLGILWSWFIAPTVGLALVLVLATRLSVWGLPVKNFGPLLTIILFVAACGILVSRRPTFPWRKLAPFFAVVCLYLLYTGWPMLRFGFNWISYGNDDMANYCLAADRFLHHGYYDLPLQTQLEGRDYTQHYWFMHGLQQIRPGSELTIAWIASLTGRNAHEVFMPAILLMSMMQIFALGSIAIYRGRYRKLTFLAFILFATSPLFGLGTLYQLIAQVGGISVLLAATSVLLSTRGLGVRKLLLAALLTTCLGILYPEVAPFVALSIVLFGLRLRYTDTARFKSYAGFVIGTAVLTFVFLGTSTYEFINTLVMQSVGSAGLGAMTEINDQSGGLVLFPWTLVPSFIPMLVGLHPFGKLGTDPIISIKILAGAALLVFIAYRAYRNLRKDAPVGYVATIMFPLGFFLFFKGQDFGLFKLAMWAQPVIMLLLAQGFGRWILEAKNRRRGLIIMGVYIALTMPSSIYYSIASLGSYGGGLTEVVHASDSGVAFHPPTDLKYQAIESDISNVVSAKMLAQYTKGIDTRFLSRSYMDNIANIAVLKFLRTPNPDLGPQARIIEKLSLLRFLLPKEIMKDDVPDYKVMSIQKVDNNWTDNSSRHLDYNDRLFVAIRSDLDHFNKGNPGEGWTVQNTYQYKLESQVKDRLVFIHSELSPHYYSSARFKAAFFQREPEPITHGQVSFHGTGRYNLFNIIHPSQNLRMLIDFTRTSLGRGRSKLPQKAIVIGEEDYHLPFVGYGSARIVSPILKPEILEKEAYITLDFGEDPAPIEKDKTGLMRLYGVKFQLDDRRLVGFTRDISVLTDEQYQNMPRPSRISEFPEDLSRYPGFEYSGLYEDGWVAEDAYFKLGSSHPGQVLSFKGFVPDTAKFRTQGVDVTISINGKPTEIVNLKAGDFTLTRLITEAAQITSIALHFSDAEPYGSGDPRPVSAFVKEFSIDDVADLQNFGKDNAGSGKPALKGIDDDGWLERTASFHSAASNDFNVLKIDLEMPGWSTLASNDLKVLLNGSVYKSFTIPRETYQSIYVPLVPGADAEVKLEAGATFPLKDDPRQRSFLLKNISVEHVGPTDLFARGWYRSGYQFSIDHADDDGWVDKKIAFRFPAAKQYKRAIVTVIRYPAKADLPLGVQVDSSPAATHSLELEKEENIVIPLSANAETSATLSTDRDFPLAAPDTRTRSFRIVKIGFE